MSINNNGSQVVFLEFPLSGYGQREEGCNYVSQ
jgi:hypothetical protein